MRIEKKSIYSITILIYREQSAKKMTQNYNLHVTKPREGSAIIKNEFYKFNNIHIHTQTRKINS